MASIMTALGAIDSANLGVTSMHEHCLCDGSVFKPRAEPFLHDRLPVNPEDPISLENYWYARHNFLLLFDTMNMTEEDVLIEELTAFKVSGGSAVVEMSTPGLRWDVNAFCRASKRTGVHIIVPTGLYALDTWPEKFSTMSVDELADFMIKEVGQGIEDSGVYPGHIKVAMETDFHPREVDALRAAARASNQTGLMVTVHQGINAQEDTGNRIIDIMKTENVDLSRLVIAHSDSIFVEKSLAKLVLEPESWGLNIEPAKGILETGANISLDLFGHFWDLELLDLIPPADWQSLAGLVALIKSGYSEQIVLGTDSFLKLQLRKYGGEGYCRLTNYVIPVLRKLEIPEKDIDNITVKNPARLLGV